MLNTKRAFIFDLDGTLIDSSESILCALSLAFERANIVPIKPLTSDLIGPSLESIIRKVVGETDSFLLLSIAGLFREEYDGLGYKKTKYFPGIDRVLQGLSEMGHALYLVTNKRETPTLRILDMFSWAPFFQAIYTSGLGGDEFQGKSALIRKLLADNCLSSDNTLMIGDTIEDADAAAKNNLCFYGVAWGYGSLTCGDNLTVLRNPTELLTL
jgi:phosphoglycolate phosphatase